MVAMRHVAAVLALTVLSSTLAAAQSAPGGKPPRPMSPEFIQMKIVAWTAAARAHVAGSIDEPVRTIASWPRDHVGAVISQQLGRLGDLRRRRDAGNVPAGLDLADLTATLRRGLALHTDVALAERHILTQRPSARPGAAVFLVDGRVTRQVERSPHWVFGRQIAVVLAPDPGESAGVLQWFRAVAAALEEWGDYDVAAVHLEAAEPLFPRDGMLALYRGTLYQTLGDARLQDYMRGRLRDTATVLRRLDAMNRPPRAELPQLRRFPRTSLAQLEMAERELRLAITLDPALPEARIRLAHVLSRLADDQGAADAVRPALDAPLPPFLEFYAALILGRSEEHLGRFAEADAAYARAAARFPDAPTPRIGRSRVALARGRGAEALAMVVDVSTRPVAKDADPWLSYLRQHEPTGHAQLAAWWAALK